MALRRQAQKTPPGVLKKGWPSAPSLQSNKNKKFVNCSSHIQTASAANPGFSGLGADHSNSLGCSELRSSTQLVSDQLRSAQLLKLKKIQHPRPRKPVPKVQFVQPFTGCYRLLQAVAAFYSLFQHPPPEERMVRVKASVKPWSSHAKIKQTISTTIACDEFDCFPVKASQAIIVGHRWHRFHRKRQGQEKYLKYPGTARMSPVVNDLRTSDFI
jgi:hypothetical protein